jgi:hypothetical protein
MEAIAKDQTYENLKVRTFELMSNRYSLPQFGRIKLKRVDLTRFTNL